MLLNLTIPLLDNEENVVVKYAYDAWGNQKIVDCNGNEVVGTNHIGNLNPFRYRSYYYDIETNLYFLKTRYYDPEICRFITIDDLKYLRPDTINGINLYAYCRNNPVKYMDSEGTDAYVYTLYTWNANGRTGIPILGHSLVAIQDGEQWVLTQYTGEIRDKSTAKIETDVFESKEEVDKYIEEICGVKKNMNIFQDILYVLTLYGYDEIKISGDFSGALEKDENGNIISIDLPNWEKKGYNLVAHNCLQYVVDVVKKGKNLDPLTFLYVHNPLNIVPSIFSRGAMIMEALKEGTKWILDKLFKK